MGPRISWAPERFPLFPALPWRVTRLTFTKTFTKTFLFQFAPLIVCWYIEKYEEVILLIPYWLQSSQPIFTADISNKEKHRWVTSYYLGERVILVFFLARSQDFPQHSTTHRRNQALQNKHHLVLKHDKMSCLSDSFIPPYLHCGSTCYFKTSGQECDAGGESKFTFNLFSLETVKC